jgi:hypothetical protein
VQKKTQEAETVMFISQFVARMGFPFQGKEHSMNAGLIFVVAMTLGLCGCANTNGQNSGKATAAKVNLDQTPPAVRETIKHELVGAELEDIAQKQRDGKTVYETDIIKPGGQKWEVVVAEDGKIVSKLQEGSAEEQAEDKREAQEAGWREDFDVPKANLQPTGANPLIPIQPGRVLKLTDGKDSLTVTILPETSTIDGVKCGVLEERETKNGKLIEVSRNFFATDPATNDVYYFGEDVDNYKDGKIVDHESGWHAGEKGAKFGLMIPGKPKAGDKFYQEIAPKIAMDRVEIVSTDDTVKTPAGTFQHCVHLKETTPLEADVSHKYFAPGIGVIKDDEFELAEKP